MGEGTVLARLRKYLRTEPLSGYGQENSRRRSYPKRTSDGRRSPDRALGRYGQESSRRRSGDLAERAIGRFLMGESLPTEP
jgi:hypothetical protein